MAEVTITVRPNGPFRVEGPIRLVDGEGAEWNLSGKPAVSLCRCGASTKKPFCDGAHTKIGFQAAEAAVIAQDPSAADAVKGDNAPKLERRTVQE